MKVDFTKVQIEDISGEVVVMDFSKTLGNGLYQGGRTLEVVELARSIWRDGEVELTSEDIDILKTHIPQLFPTYIIQSALLNLIK